MSEKTPESTEPFIPKPHDASPQVANEMNDVLATFDAAFPLERRGEAVEEVKERLSSISVSPTGMVGLSFSTQDLWRSENMGIELSKTLELIKSNYGILRRDGMRALRTLNFSSDDQPQVAQAVLTSMEACVEDASEAYDLYHSVRTKLTASGLVPIIKAALTRFPTTGEAFSFCYDLTLFEEGLDWCLAESMKSTTEAEPAHLAAVVNGLARFAVSGGPWFWSRFNEFQRAAEALGPVRGDVLQRAMKGIGR